MPDNKEIIRMHLEHFIQREKDQSWYSLLGYCIGYYGTIDMDILSVVHDLQWDGKIR